MVNCLELFFFNRCIEALTRAGQSDRTLIPKAVSMFEVRCRNIIGTSLKSLLKDFLLYLNHVGLCTEEISDAGVGCVNPNLQINFGWELRLTFRLYKISGWEMQFRDSRGLFIPLITITTHASLKNKVMSP